MHHFEICNRDLDNFNVSNFGYDKRSSKKDHIKKDKEIIREELDKECVYTICLFVDIQGEVPSLGVRRGNASSMPHHIFIVRLKVQAPAVTLRHLL